MELARLSRKLATIMLDAPVEWEEERLRVGDVNADAIRAVFEELEFKTLLKRVLGDPGTPKDTGGGGRGKAKPASDQGTLFDTESFTTPAEVEAVVPTNLKTIEDVPHEYHLVDTAEGVDALLEQLMAAPSFCFDTETSDIEPINAILVGMSFALKPGQAWYVAVPQDRPQAEALLAKFQPLFADPEKELVAQNYKYDFKMLKKYGVEVHNKVFDTMVAHYLINPDGKHGMDFLSEIYLGYQPISIAKLIGKKGKAEKSMADLPPAEIKDYAAEDADITLQLKHKFDGELDRLDARRLFNLVEVPLISVLAEMELEGVRIDENFLQSYSKELESDIKKLEAEVHAAAGESFNVDSPKQLGAILFEKLRITTDVKKTKTGQYSTDEATLSKYQHDHPIIGHVLNYREMRKLKSTYVDALPTMVNPYTGRVHTNYMQTVAATGRLSSNNPNLQNIPIRTPRGQEIRKAFIPRNEEHTILSADYSQVELRIIAALSNDENMIDAFLQGEDIHRATAAKVFGVPMEAVDKAMRSKAKAVNFGILYGQGAFGLAQTIGIPRGEAKQIIDAYFAQFHRLKSYQAETIDSARKRGYVETLLGRRRYLPDINSANAVVRGYGERNAINAPIQGSAADIIKVAMINIQSELRKMNLRSKMIMQVHDELVFDAHVDELDVLKPLIREKMMGAVAMRVPLEVEMNTGVNWLEAH